MVVYYLQRDQYSRCTVGWFNWVPELLNVEKTLFPEVIANEMHTALHEIVHVLGGIGPGSGGVVSTFIDNTGAPMSAASVWMQGTDTAYDKPMTFIVTPKVRAVARATFGCASMPGFPLEDLLLGAGSHWYVGLAWVLNRRLGSF